MVVLVFRRSLILHGMHGVLFFLVCAVCRDGGASSWELMVMAEEGRQELKARSVRRNGTAVWGN
jgi:hypothetical protein